MPESAKEKIKEAKSEFTEQDKRELLSLARRSIESRLEGKTASLLKVEVFSSAVAEPRACFVTLTKGGQLRGCVGNFNPKFSLYDEVIRNARQAAFEDKRFPAVRSEELPKIVIEISVLSPLKPLRFGSAADLCRALVPGRDGVILTLGDKSATYLPQVWQQISNTEEFLSSLCVKAGLPPDAWQERRIQIETYQTTDSFEDSNF